jgi:glycosyltransferase involved in cell wall biosynthesis
MRVSVILLTYNHERFIAQALDSVLGQRTAFPFEVLVTEDCSTDRTREILADYAARRPATLRLFLSPQNLNTNEVVTRALDAARGELVAFLDGDDYWSTDTKLQRQADFLDAHPECVLCYHHVAVLHDGSDAPPDARIIAERKPFADGHDILEHNFIPGCSALIRRAAITPMPAWYRDAEWGDWPLYIVAARHGLLGYIPETMGVYRQHAGGYWSSASKRTQSEGLVRFFDRLERNLGPEWRRDLHRSRAVWYAELSDALEAEGALGPAAKAMMASLRDHPAIGDHRVRRRIRKALALLWRRLAARVPR